MRFITKTKSELCAAVFCIVGVLAVLVAPLEAGTSDGCTIGVVRRRCKSLCHR